jgi:hypothetical protein
MINRVDNEKGIKGLVLTGGELSEADVLCLKKSMEKVGWHSLPLPRQFSAPTVRFFMSPNGKLYAKLSVNEYDGLLNVKVSTSIGWTLPNSSLSEAPERIGLVSIYMLSLIADLEMGIGSPQTKYVKSGEKLWSFTQAIKSTQAPLWTSLPLKNQQPTT